MNIPTTAIALVSLTIADMDRSIAFYTNVLSCQKISDHEVAGVEFDRLYGVEPTYGQKSARWAGKLYVGGVLEHLSK